MAKTKKASAVAAKPAPAAAAPAAATVTKPKAPAKKAAAPAGASLADAFAQSAAFFGKKATYAAPEEPVEEPTEDAEAQKPAETPAAAGDAEDKPKKKKKKKDKKRKLEEAEAAAATEGGEDATADADAAAVPSTEEIAPDSVAAALGRGTDKSERTIFVGNVSLDATQSALKSFFSPCGKVESVRLRFLPVAGTAVNDHGNQKLMMKVCANQKIFTDKRDFCHAYVTFATKEGVEKALLKNRSLFLNKTLRIDHENPVVDPQRSVFVGNLSFAITDETVWAWFDKQLKTDEEPFPVENVRVIRDRETGAGKGFGYVLLKGKALAAKALSLAGKKLQNRELRVQVCGKRTKNKKGEDVAALKHEGRRATGAAGRVVAKKKARGELVLPSAAKKARIVTANLAKKTGKPIGKKGAAAGAVGKKGVAAKGGKKVLGKGGKRDAKPRKTSGLAPGVKPKKPKHAARKARQAAEAAAAAKANK